MSLFDRAISAEEKMHSPIRELKITPKEGAKKSDAGLVDPGLFKGDNHLYAIMEDSGLWTCKYDKGELPQPLKQRFTSAKKLVDHAREYFAKRNLDVTEIKDVHAS